MDTLVLVTSIIDTPNIPLSYGKRSIFTTEQRFEQTKNTIKSIKDKIPNAKIFVIECSIFNKEQELFFTENSDYLLNLYYDLDIRNNIYSISKSLCEGTMTINAFNYIIKNNIKFDNLIKISGRYYLSENFNYNNFINDKIVIKYINRSINNVFTGLYKLPYLYVLKFKQFLENNKNKMLNCIGYEVLFAEFICEINLDVINFDTIGLAGYVSVGNDFYNG